MKTSTRLGKAVFYYMVVVILLITLAPFSLKIPDSSSRLFYWDAPLFDIIANVAFFIPFGFLCAIAYRRPVITSIIFGFVLSTLIELTQIFLPGRFSTVTDVLANAFGAYLGAILFIRSSRFLQARLVDVLSFELPLMSIVYLLTPLIWISSLASWKNPARLILISLPAIVVVIIVAAIWLNRKFRLERPGIIWPAAFIFVWILVAGFPGLITFPVIMLSIAVSSAILFLVLVTFYQNWFKTEEDKRFEIPTLRKSLPYLILYLAAISSLPLDQDFLHWNFNFQIPDMSSDPSLPEIFQFIEYLTCVSLLGYAFGELFGRQQLNRLLSSVALFCVIALMEMLRGMISVYPGSFLRFVIATGAGFTGVAIYRIQLTTIRNILQRNNHLL